MTFPSCKPGWPIGWFWSTSIVAVMAVGCNSPENGRVRGGGPGGDAGNYHQKPVHAPSKLDGTKDVDSPFARP